MNDVNREQLATDLRHVLDDVESLLSQAAQASGQQAHDLRERATAQLQRARTRVAELQDTLGERSRAAARATDTWVHAHPWGAIALGAGVAFLVGLLVSRR